MRPLSRAFAGGIPIAMIAVAIQAATNTQVVIPLRCGGLAYDATGGVFYASARANAGAFSNCLLRIEPFSGATTLITNFDSEPGSLALSAKHRAVYVALPGQATARRFDLTSQSLGSRGFAQETACRCESAEFRPVFDFFTIF